MIPSDRELLDKIATESGLWIAAAAERIEQLRQIAQARGVEHRARPAMGH